MAFVIMVVDFFIRLLSFLVIVHVFLGYFMSPYHPVRTTINRIIEPMLMPIRRIVPLIGMMDFSPFILLIFIQVFGQIIIVLLRSLG